jgi:MoaA/NifB/PqqE/SkfB family radical SAM enzyme
MWWRADWVRRAAPHAEAGVLRRLTEEKRWRKLANYLWVETLMARGARRLWGGKPYWLTIDPTNFCQLQCPFCPTGANRGVRDKANMTLEHFARFMETVGPTAIHVDFMNWGESLLNKSLPEMVAVAKSYGAEVKLDANFNDVSEETIERLVLSKLDVLSLSIDGLTQETYERYRKGGRLDKVLANLETLARKRRELRSETPRVVWQFLVFRHNEHEAAGVEAFAKARGADQVSLVAPFLPNEPGYLWHWSARDPRYQMYKLPDEKPSQAELARVAADPHAKKTPSALAFHARRFTPGQILGPKALLSSLRGVRGLADARRALTRAAKAAASSRRAGRVPFQNAAERPICKWPWAGMALNPNGSVSPCCSVEDQNDDFGNVFTHGWAALWNGPRYRRARAHVARTARGRAGPIADSDHVCERCTAIGYANFRFPPGWEER